MNSEYEKMKNLWKQLGIEIRRNGKPYCDLISVIKVLERWTPVRELAWFDEVKQELLTKDSKGVVRNWTKTDTFNLTLRLQIELMLFRVSEVNVGNAVEMCARKQAKLNNSEREKF